MILLAGAKTIFANVVTHWISGLKILTSNQGGGNGPPPPFLGRPCTVTRHKQSTAIQITVRIVAVILTPVQKLNYQEVCFTRLYM